MRDVSWRFLPEVLIIIASNDSNNQELLKHAANTVNFDTGGKYLDKTTFYRNLSQTHQHNQEQSTWLGPSLAHTLLGLAAVAHVTGACSTICDKLLRWFKSEFLQPGDSANFCDWLLKSKSAILFVNINRKSQKHQFSGCFNNIQGFAAWR